MRKRVALAMIVLLVLSLMAGCQGAATTTKATTAATTATTAGGETTATTAGSDNPWANLDLSKAETISVYFVGAPGNDWQKVVDKANELMKTKINTTVKFTHIPFSDFQTKYSLFMAGDEEIDLIYGAAWVNYMEYVKSGAYKALSEDFLKTYMPLTWEKQAPVSWKEATYNGSIYCVPRNDTGIGGSGVATTKDLLDKYKFAASDIKGWDDLKSYMMAIAEGEKGTGVYALSTQGSWPADVYWFTGKNHLWEINAGNSTWMVWDYAAGKEFNVADLNWLADTEAYKNFCLEMAEFNKAGCFPADILSSQTFINDAFMAGSSAINFVSPQQANGMAITMQEKGKELVYLDCLFDDQSKTRRGNYMGYGACFPVASKKAERAAVALDCMKFDPEVNRLLVGGIEGEHFTLNTDGTRSLGPKAADYGWGSWFYLLQHDADPQLKLRDDLQVFQKRYEAAEVPSSTFPINGFNYDTTKYQAEIAVLSSLFMEYRFSFCFGVFQDNTLAKYNEFVAKAKAAGIDEIVTDIRAQMQAYINS